MRACIHAQARGGTNARMQSPWSSKGADWSVGQVGSLLAEQNDYLTASASQGCCVAIVVVSMTDAGGLADLSKRLASLKDVPIILVATKYDDVPARQMTMVRLLNVVGDEPRMGQMSLCGWSEGG